MMIERWRAKRSLPGAKHELHTKACLFSDVSGPKLLVLTADEQCRPDAAQLFNNFCSAIEVSYGLVKDTVSANFPTVPALLFTNAELTTVAQSLFQIPITLTQELSAGLHHGMTKSAWWRSIMDIL